MLENTDYRIFLEFIRTYSATGFRGINNQDHFMVRLNRVLNKGSQFIWVADIPRFELIYTSQQVTGFFGIEPEQYTLDHNLARTHPLDLKRRNLGRVKVIQAGHALYLNKAGTHLISTEFRTRNFEDEYINVLVQVYLFYVKSPVESVFALVINTPLTDFFANLQRKKLYHWYSGNNPAYFRYPDEELLHIGCNLTERELEILRQIHEGRSSKEIGKSVSLSHHTINTHRRNILKKTGKSSIGELIYELEDIGLI